MALDGTIVICDLAFCWCKNLQEISLPSGLTSIGKGAFIYCSNLQEIILPPGVTSIGKGAFQWCRNFQKISVTESNKSYRAIDGVLYTKDLKTIICYPKGKEEVKFVIPSGVTSIGDSAFRGCKNLQEITLPSSITSVGNNAFLGCKNLLEITLPHSITSIKSDIFRTCYNLQRINIPTGTLEKFKELLPEWTDKLHEV